MSVETVCKYCVYYSEGYCWNFMEETNKDDSCDSFIKDESENKE